MIEIPKVECVINREEM